ncbi:class I SAM-dependent methyltransferase, partial [Patescibacteria group bacterium]|nr:class I SAM-dependent methyltransferase [Patescibacteria group bacterium]
MDFDEFAQDYQKIHSKNIRLSGETPDYFHRYKLNLVKNFYCRNKLKEPKKILDFGCGIGKIEQHILSYFPNSKVIGIDSSTESIDRAKS